MSLAPTKHYKVDMLVKVISFTHSLWQLEEFLLDVDQIRYNTRRDDSASQLNSRIGVECENDSPVHNMVCPPIHGLHHRRSQTQPFRRYIALPTQPP